LGHLGTNASLGLQYPLVAEKKTLLIDKVDPMYSKLIPRQVWIASCKGLTPLVKENTEKIKKSSPNWDIKVFVRNSILLFYISMSLQILTKKKMNS
jgi:hypothetical protein